MFGVSALPSTILGNMLELKDMLKGLILGRDGNVEGFDGIMGVGCESLVGDSRTASGV